MYDINHFDDLSLSQEQCQLNDTEMQNHAKSKCLTSYNTLIDVNDTDIRLFQPAKSRSETRRNCGLSIMDRSAGGRPTQHCRQRWTAVGHVGRMLLYGNNSSCIREHVAAPPSDARSKTQWPPASLRDGQPTSDWLSWLIRRVITTGVTSRVQSRLTSFHDVFPVRISGRHRRGSCISCCLGCSVSAGIRARRLRSVISLSPFLIIPGWHRHWVTEGCDCESVLSVISRVQLVYACHRRLLLIIASIITS